MTLRQFFLKAFYPILMLLGKLKGKEMNQLRNEKMVSPISSFYQLQSIKNNGDTVFFNQLMGKKVLIVNSASNCGFTPQYEQLEKLHERFADSLVILAFPANDFKQQEKGDDASIEKFCKINFGVTFPLMQKSVVIKSKQQNEVFKWLSDTTKNGWCNQAPTWNFSKYLIDENGVLINYFAPTVSPLSNEVLKAIQ
jgi:glutathione peroxidase